MRLLEPRTRTGKSPILDLMARTWEQETTFVTARA